MRIRVNRTDIFEISEVIITPGGFPDPDNPRKYTNMSCSMELRYAEGEYGAFYGEFNCEGATTMEECESAALPFVDELFEKGYIDISTDEKCEKYKLILW